MGQLIHIRPIDMFAKIAFVALVASCAVAENPFSGYNQSPPEQQNTLYRQPEPAYSNNRNTYESHEEGMPFNYNWAVKDDYSGNDYNHRSESDGEVTQGEYRVLLPDGRTQIVTYRSDPISGFEAEVTYEGEARPYEAQASSNNQYRAPRPQPKPQPTYQQPQPTYQQPQPTQVYNTPQPTRPSNNYIQPEPSKPSNTYSQ